MGILINGALHDFISTKDKRRIKGMTPQDTEFYKKHRMIDDDLSPIIQLMLHIDVEMAELEAMIEKAKAKYAKNEPIKDDFLEGK